MRVVQLLRQEGGVRLFGRLIGIAVWMTFFPIRFPLSGDLRHRDTERQIELVQPRFICTLGGSAAQAVLGTTASLGKLRGRFHLYRDIPVLCTYHPAYLLPHRHPEKKRDVWEDMKLLMARMGKPVK